MLAWPGCTFFLPPTRDLHACHRSHNNYLLRLTDNMRCMKLPTVNTICLKIFFYYMQIVQINCTCYLFRRYLFCVPPVHAFSHHSVESCDATIATTSCNSVPVYVQSCRDVFMVCVCVGVCVCGVVCVVLALFPALSSMWWWCQPDHLSC